MSEQTAPNSTEVLYSLRLLRSSDARERERGIFLLNGLLDDPRVQQVFEVLSREDPDPAVREAARRALNPTHAAPAAEAAPAAAPRPRPTPAPAPLLGENHHAPGRLFLASPANAPLVAAHFANRSQRSRSKAGLLALLLLILGLLAGLVLPDWVTWARLQQSGVAARGWITGKETREGSGGVVRYSVSYRFSQDDSEEGPLFAGKQQVTREAFNRLAEDTPIEVTYLPSDPDVSRIAEALPGDRTRYGLTALAGGVLLLILLLLVLDRIPYPRLRLFRRPGIIKGKVILATGVMDPEGDYNVKLRYQFQTPSGRTVVDQISQIRNDLKQAPLPEPGTPVAVYYEDPYSYRLL